MKAELKAMAQTLSDWHKIGRLDDDAMLILCNMTAKTVLEKYSKDWAGISYDLGDGKVKEVSNEIRKDANDFVGFAAHKDT